MNSYYDAIYSGSQKFRREIEKIRQEQSRRSYELWEAYFQFRKKFLQELEKVRRLESKKPWRYSA